MPIDIERARYDTPSCTQLIHFNNAGAALMPQSVLESLIAHLQLETEIGGYEAAQAKQDLIEHTYDSLARLLNCYRNEIAIIENATRAWDMAFYSINFKAGDRILTAVSEYASNYISYLQIARKTGAEIIVIPNDEYGQVSTDALRQMIDERVKLITTTHVPTNGGLVNPAVEIGKIAREANILYLLDACQSVGQMPLDVQEIGCDMLSATGRKYLRGPRGTGFLFVRREIIEQLEPPFLDLHAADWTAHNQFTIREDARRFENWETNYAGKIGLGVAVDYALSFGLEEIDQRVKMLAEMLREQLSVIDGVIVRDLGRERCGIVTFTMEGKDPLEIRRLLNAQKINVWSTSIESTRIDMEQRHIESVVRASVHYYNTEEEIARFCVALEALV
jgi:selenocysteine lyase/cysteine desulfurase